MPQNRQASKAGAEAGAKARTKASAAAALPLAPYRQSVASQQQRRQEGMIAVRTRERAAAAVATPKEEVPLGTSDLVPAAAVRWLVKSLYCEEVLPRGPLLQWFLYVLLGVKLSHKDLRDAIEAAEGVRMDPPAAKKLNFNAVLEEEPADFKGFVSDEDVAEALTEELWAEAYVCLSQGGWPTAEDIGHKYYVVASWLQDVSEMFCAWSFGRVLAVVRFAGQADCILGHCAGLLVPYEHSEECRRRVNAWTGVPTHVQDGEAYVRSWPELQECLHRLLQDRDPETLEVSKLKIMFRSLLGLELSETVFGHQCLSRLLADPLLGEDFVLEMCQGNRYMLRLLAPRKELQSSKTVARAKDAGPQLPPPPGLSLPEESVASPGVSPSPTRRGGTRRGGTPPIAEDLKSWPSLSDAAKGESPLPLPSNGVANDGAELIPPPPGLGLTPEKIARKVHPEKQVYTVPNGKKTKQRIWTSI